MQVIGTLRVKRTQNEYLDFSFLNKLNVEWNSDSPKQRFQLKIYFISTEGKKSPEVNQQWMFILVELSLKSEQEKTKNSGQFVGHIMKAL